MSEEKKCNHEDQWQGLGTLAINVPRGELVIIHNIFCKRCGETRMKTISLTNSNPSNIAIPITKFPLNKRAD